MLEDAGSLSGSSRAAVISAGLEDGGPSPLGEPAAWAPHVRPEARAPEPPLKPGSGVPGPCGRLRAAPPPHPVSAVLCEGPCGLSPWWLCPGPGADGEQTCGERGSTRATDSPGQRRPCGRAGIGCGEGLCSVATSSPPKVPLL